MNTGTLPIIDLSACLSGSAADGKMAADAIRRACEEIGFFLVSGHGVEETLIEKSYLSVKRFFDLPLDEKMQTARQSSAVSRGYDNSAARRCPRHWASRHRRTCRRFFLSGRRRSAIRRTIAKATAASILRQSVAAPSRRFSGSTPKTTTGPWSAFSGRLMRLFALALQLPEDFFGSKIDRQISSIRFINYPDQPDAPVPGQLRAGAHSDYGTLTILRIEDAPGGLQVQDRQGRWLDVGYVPAPSW